jgi:hypothetical protein
MSTPALPPAASGRARGAAVLAAMGGVLGLLVSTSSGCPNDPPATTGDSASGGPEDGGPGDDDDDDGADGGLDLPPPDPDCVDNQHGNHDRATAYELYANGVDHADPVHPTIAGVLCEGSDWYVLEMPCVGYFGVEARVSDESGVVRVTFHQGQTVERQTSGSFAIHAIHRPVVPQTYYVEVEHVSGTAVTYDLRAYLLPDGTCTSASYLCHADALEIDATEASCSSFPAGGSCPTGQTYTQAVALPEVSDGMSGWVEGWAIHVGSEEIRNIHRPTSTELGMLHDRCVVACKAEWAATDEITADCDAVGAFTAITLRQSPSTPARALVPAMQQDGSELFPMQTLSCNLHTSCCEEFSSHLCPFRPDRVTPGNPLLASTREQYVLGLDGSTMMIAGAAAPTGVDGVVRFSDADDTAAEPQVVYVADLSIVSETSTELELDCNDGSRATPTISLFAFGLTQPAFGVRRTGTAEVAFPPGALTYRIGVLVNSVITWVDAVNALPVYGELSPAGIDLQLAQVVRVPCNGGTTDILLMLDLVDDAVIAEPPEVTINLASTMSCPGVLGLSATVTDPNADVDTVRWFVDDHLLAPSVTQVTVPSGSPVFAVVACDSRGACTRAERTVSCT